MSKNSFNGLFAGPGKVILLDDEGVKPRVTLPDDELCRACGDAYTVLEVIDGRCFCCRYHAELNKETK